MDHPHPLSVSYLCPAQLGRQSAAWRQRALGYVTFADGFPYREAAGVPVVRVDAPVLGGRDGFMEVWHGAPTVSAGQRGAVRYSHNDDLLFGYVALQEADFSAAPAGAEGTSPLQRATKHAFQEIFGLIDGFNYPYLLRILNYFPAINEDSHGLERYRQFNIGRQEGFAACGRPLTENVPASCALGAMSGKLTIYFIAGRNRPVAIENPRQVSAYHYPADYGPRSPTFSRAALARVGAQEVLFISGTSSIVGHRTVHVGDVAAQTKETLTNIESVVGEANRLIGGHRYDLENMSYKVYLRRAEDVDVIHRELMSTVRPKVRPIYVKADICRQDLLVEIEAIAGVPVEMA